MAKHKTRQQLVLREKAREFERDGWAVDDAMRLRSGRYNLFEHQTSEHAVYYGFSPSPIAGVTPT